MTYGGVYRHSAGLVEHHKAVILKGNGDVQSAVWFKEAVVGKAENYDVTLLYFVYTAYGLTITGYATLPAFKPCQQPP